MNCVELYLPPLGSPPVQTDEEQMLVLAPHLASATVNYVTRSRRVIAWGDRDDWAVAFVRS